MMKHFESTLSPEEYHGALTRALQKATWYPRDGRRGHWQPPHSAPLGYHGEVFGLLLRAGASLRQDPDREEDAGLVARAVHTRPLDAIWLLQRQMDRGMTDHRDVRPALRRAGYCWYGGVFGDKCTMAHHQFFEFVYPTKAHLACDPRQLITPEDRKKALNDLTIELVRNGCSKYMTHLTICKDMEWYMEEEVGHERMDEIKGKSGGKLLYGPSRKEDGPDGGPECYREGKPTTHR